MKNTYNDFVLKNGLTLGIFFSIFPISFFLFGENMSLKVYFFLFWFVWLIVTIYMLLNFGRQKREKSEIFDFKNAFKVMFLISALGLLLLSATKTTLWHIMYPEKYISLHQAKDKKIMNNLFDFMNSKLDKAYQDGNLTDDNYDDNITELEEQKKSSIEAINSKWQPISDEGLGKMFFLQELIANLFFFSIVNVILALIIKRKQVL
tara:strand:- start:215 stop:832 length:618 start_codon:yes stop_codon:yes gene_type:complete